MEQKLKMYRVLIKHSNKIIYEFSVSERDLDDAKLHYGEDAFKGHSLKEQIDLAAIYRTKFDPIKIKTEAIENIGLEWELINNEGKVIF